MEQSENILLKKAKIEVLENDIRVLKEEIAAEHNERVKRTGYVILSEPQKEFWNRRSYVHNIDIQWLDNLKSVWTDNGIWGGEYEIHNCSFRDIEPDRRSWISNITIFKTKEIAEYIVNAIHEKWGITKYHVYDMRQLKEIMNEQPYINSKASKVL